MSDNDSAIQIEITDSSAFHCFGLKLTSQEGTKIEIMLHATQLVDLLHKGNLALSEWQRMTTQELILRMTGMNEETARKNGLIA